MAGVLIRLLSNNNFHKKRGCIITTSFFIPVNTEQINSIIDCRDDLRRMLTAISKHSQLNFIRSI
jgi:hypothetical protein